MVVPAGHSKQAVVHLLHAKNGSCFHFRRDRGCRLPVRREVACSACRRRAKLLVFSTEKRRDRDSGAGGTAARATLPEPPSSMPPSEALTAAYGPCRAAPGLLEAAGASRARKKKLTRRQAGLLLGVQGPGRSRASTAGGRDGREPQAAGWRRAGSGTAGQGPDPGPSVRQDAA